MRLPSKQIAGPTLVCAGGAATAFLLDAASFLVVVGAVIAISDDHVRA